MALIVCLLIGFGFGVLLTSVHIKEQRQRINRERWRKYAAAKKARRG